MAHLSLKQRSPFRNNFIPSRRQSRQTAPVENGFSLPVGGCVVPVRSLVTNRERAVDNGGNAKSDAATLRGAAAVVRNGRDILDRLDVKAGSGQSADGALAAGAGTLDLHVDRAHAV